MNKFESGFLQPEKQENSKNNKQEIVDSTEKEPQTPQTGETTGENEEKELNPEEKNASELLKATANIKELRPVIKELIETLQNLDMRQSMDQVNEIYDNAIEKINKLLSVINFLPEEMEKLLMELNPEEENVSELLKATTNIKELRPVIKELIETLQNLDMRQSMDQVNEIYDNAIEKINKLLSVINFLPEEMEKRLRIISKKEEK